MMEFGAKLSLKDGMSNTLQKNLQKQREFQKQIQQTRRAVQQASKQKMKLIADTTGISKAVKEVNKVKNKIRDVGRTITKPIINVKDNASRIIGNINGKLKRVGKFVATPFVKLKDGASKILSSMGSMLKTLAKGATIALAVTGAGAMALLSKGSMLEQQQISMEHFIGVNNGDKSQDQIKQMSDNYLKELRNNANLTPFTTNEVISAGSRAINIAGGDTTQAMDMLKVAEDMASLNPEKSLSDAIEAIADMKNGETERMKEFGFKISAEDIEKAGGTEAIIKNQLAPYFMGGAEKLSQSASGMVSTIKGNIGSALTDTGLAMLEKVKPLLEKMVGFTNTLAPKLQGIGEKIADGFGAGIEWITNLTSKAGGVSPIFSNIGSTLKSVFGGMKAYASEVFPAIVENIKAILPVFSSIGQTVGAVFPMVARTIASAWNASIPVTQAFANLIKSAMPVVQGIITVFSRTVETLMPVVSRIFAGVSSKVGEVIDFIGSKMGFIQDVFNFAVPLISDILSTAWSIISPIMDIMISVFKAVWEVVEFVFPAIQAVIETVWSVLDPIFSAIADALTWVGDAVDSVIGWFGDVFSGVFDGGADGSTKTDDGKSRAMGVPRVPYDNYPLRAHQGEMLLTKREANNYLAQTRGVNIAVQPASSSGSSEHTMKETVIKDEPNKERRPVINLNIKNLIETAHIKEEADADELVDKMVTKFEKLLLVTP